VQDAQMSAFGGKADIAFFKCERPLLSQSGHSSVLLNRRFSILRTHREQNLQANCKPSLCRRQQQKEKPMSDRKLGGAPVRTKLRTRT
jgi:hypothetical protein